jgi:hypothetical protein
VGVDAFDRFAAVRREPEGEVAAGRVADGDDALQIEVVRGGEVAEVGAPPSDVLECAWPAAARFADAAELQAPRGDAGRGECGAQVADVQQVVLGAPEAAVEHDGHRVWPCAHGQTQVAELRRLCAVGNAQVRKRRNASEDLALVCELATQAFLRAPAYRLG